MDMRVNPDDPRISWYGTVSLEQGDGWVKPWRIPFEQRVLFGKLSGPDRLLSRAGMPSGVRIAFFTDSKTVGCELEPLSSDAFPVGETQTARLDVCCDGTLLESIPLLDRTLLHAKNLPSGEKLVEIWLPEYREVRVRSIDLDDNASMRPFDDPRPRWLVYGSSNTQSRGAESPVNTWPAVVARSCGLNLTNVAYGSECHLDSMVARMMRDLAADFITLEIGINIYINATLNARAFRAAFIGFIQILRERHVNTPIAVMSSIYSAERETTPNPAGFTLAGIREELSAAIDDLRAAGDANLYYIDGLDLFGADMAAMLPDNLHPSGAGYKSLGERFATRVVPRVFPSKGS